MKKTFLVKLFSKKVLGLGRAQRSYLKEKETDLLLMLLFLLMVLEDLHLHLLL